ncbi:hypothetical protein [Neoaquamicrobium sediminum]|uniref:hypothetical protein n=1 Tax=Neoaquamicrobium sediminum TaxID=1849104 RepID=UPI003BA934DD
MSAFGTVHRRNMRWGLESTSLYSNAPRTGLEAFILLAVTNSAVFSLGPAAVSLVTTALTTIATTAVVGGLQFLLMPKPPKPEDGKVPMTQAIPPRIWGMGTNRIAGAYMLWEAVEGRMYSVQALCGHKIHAITGYYLHDDAITLKETGFVEDGPNERYGNNKIWIGHRLGAVPETPYAELVTPLSGQGIWTNDHRGDGQASLAMFCIGANEKNFSKYYPQGHPRPSVVADMALMWDPRDEAQDPDDPTTWTFTKNAALGIIWQLCFNPFGQREDYHRAILPVLDYWIEEADICDEDVPRASGGTEKRYECNGWGTTETDPIAAMNAMLASCDGYLCRRGDGAQILTVGKFRESRVGVITDTDVMGRMIQYDVAEEEAVNRLVPKFTYPATDYTQSDTDCFEDVTRQITDGRVLSNDAEFAWVHQWRQARRLGKREWLRIQEKVRGTLDLRLSAFNAVYHRWIRLETPISMPALNGKIIENRRSIMSLQSGGFKMDFIQHPEDIDAWNPSEDEGAAPPVPPKPTSDNLPTPTIDGLEALGLPGGVTIRVTLIDPGNPDLTIVTYWRLKDDGTGQPGTWQPLAHTEWEADGGLVQVDISPVIADEIIEVEATYRGTRGVESPRSNREEVVSTLDSTPPVALTTFAVTGGSRHLGHAPLSFATAADDHLSRIAIYRVPAGGVLDKETHLVTRLYGVQASSTFGYVNGDNTRTNLLSNPGFDTDTVWSKGSGWSITGGKAVHAAGGAYTSISQAVSPSVGATYRYGLTISDYVIGSLTPRFTGGTTANGAIHSAGGAALGEIIAASGNNTFGLAAGGATVFDGKADDVALFLETAACAPQGEWDYYAIPENGSGIEGPTAGPVAVTIV